MRGRGRGRGGPSRGSGNRGAGTNTSRGRGNSNSYNSNNNSKRRNDVKREQKDNNNNKNNNDNVESDIQLSTVSMSSMTLEMQDMVIHSDLSPSAAVFQPNLHLCQTTRNENIGTGTGTGTTMINEGTLIDDSSNSHSRKNKNKNKNKKTNNNNKDLKATNPPSRNKHNQQPSQKNESNQPHSNTHSSHAQINNDEVNTNIDQLNSSKSQKRDHMSKKSKSTSSKNVSDRENNHGNAKQTQNNDDANTGNSHHIQDSKKRQFLNNDQATNSSRDNDSNTKKSTHHKNASNKNANNTKNTTSKSSYNTSAIPPNQPQTTNDLHYMKGSPITVLHVAEKPSIAQAIAKGLDNGNHKINSSSKSLPIHEFTTDSPFPKAPHASKTTHKVTSVAGHVFNVDFPQQYQSWDTVDPAELFHAPIQKRPCKGSVVKHLQDSAKGVHFIVLWLDCDREGENIAFEVLECCMHLMKHDNNNNNNGGNGHLYDRVYRAYFSAINPSDIQKAYHALGKPDKNQSLAVDARQELDLKVGVAFSRFQTRYFQGRYGDLDSAVLSYGPCQTPTLGFCVKRHIEIETFKPEPYWMLDLGICKNGRMFKATWDSGRSFNKFKVEELLRQAVSIETSQENANTNHQAMATIVSVVSKEKKQGRPIPLNTVGLLKACSKALGIGPHSAMQTAERLYLSGYLSYPRTESTAYPKSFDIRGTLQSQSYDSRWGTYVTELLKDGKMKSKGGVDMGDHPPITPCRAAGVHELSGDMQRVYELVTRHFIASVSHDAVWKSTKISIRVDSLQDKGNFSVRGKQMVSPGFLAVLLHKEYGDERDESSRFNNENDDNIDEEEIQDLPDFSPGEIIPLSASASTSSSSKVNVVVSGTRATLGVKEKMTTAPSYLTESELIGQMEKHGIGTDASISTHIENILKRNYVELIPGRRMSPSKLGLVLAQGYHLIDSSLVLPKIRAEIEDQCNKIAKGLAEKDVVIKKAIDIFEKKYDNFVKQISKMDVLFGSSFSQLKDVGKPFTRCGLTRRYLQYIEGPPPRLYNKFTETVYPLPAGGVIKEWAGQKCRDENCNFELCFYSVGQPERTYPLCPYCYNHPKAEWGSIPGEEEEEEDSMKNGKVIVDEGDEGKERQIRRLGGKRLLFECPHADDHPMIDELTVAIDEESDLDSKLILDPHFGPKWRLVSTREPTIVHLPKCIKKVIVLDKRDEETGCHLMKIEFKENESPLPDGSLTYTCNYGKDELLQGMSLVVHGEERSSRGGRGGRGGRRGGRGRGRGGGRGRGRGRR